MRENFGVGGIAVKDGNVLSIQLFHTLGVCFYDEMRDSQLACQGDNVPTHAPISDDDHMIFNRLVDPG